MSEVATLNEAGRLIAEVEASPRRFRRYSDYRNCGVRWLGRIPTHWKVRRLKFVADIQNSNVDKKTEAEETPVRLCNYVDVYHRDYITSDIDFMRASASKDEIRKFALRRGDVLITKDSEAWNDIAVPAYVDEEFDGVLCGYHLAQVRPRPDLADGEFLHRAFVAHPVRDQFRVRANGITRYGLSADAIASAVFPIPPLDEQKTIAAFLRRETAKIDALVAKKRRLIELLQEKRTALISRAVTKGLNPDAPMKPSGIDWIGDVPAHWEIWKGSHILQIYGGLAPESLDERGGDTPYFKVDDLNQDDGAKRNLFIESATVQVDSTSAPRAIAPPLILIPKRGAAIATNKVRIATTACLFDSNTMGIRILKKCTPEFFALVLLTRGLWDIADISTVPQINNKHINPLRIPIPPPNEQDSIVASCFEIEDRYGQLIGHVRDAIDILLEYRASLISAAVTGQIDVRAAANEEAAA